MSTESVISVVLNGVQVVCTGGYADGYATNVGAGILHFLKNADIEKFKRSLQNTKIVTQFDEQAKRYTRIIQAINSARDNLSRYTYKLPLHRPDPLEIASLMLGAGDLSEDDFEFFITYFRNTNCRILPFIYERSPQKPLLELVTPIAILNAMHDFALNPGFRRFTKRPGDWHYVIDLDKRLVKIEYYGYIWWYSLDALPSDINKEMQVCETVLSHLPEAKSPISFQTLSENTAKEAKGYCEWRWPETFKPKGNKSLEGEDFGAKFAHDLLCQQYKLQCGDPLQIVMR